MRPLLLAAARRARLIGLPGDRPRPGPRAPGRHRGRRSTRREPDRPAGQPGRHAARRAGGAAGPASPGPRPVAGRPTPDHRRQDERARRRGPGHRRHPAARAAPEDAGRPAAALGAVGEHPRARQGRPAQLHRPAVLPGRPARFPERRQRLGGRVRRGGGRHDARRALDPPARRPRAPAQGGDPGRPRGVARTARGSTSAATCRTRCWRWTSPTAACGACSTSASRPTTSCSPAARPTCRTGAAAARCPASSPAPPAAGTEVKVDPVKHVASEGSVTVIDLASPGSRWPRS